MIMTKNLKKMAYSLMSLTWHYESKFIAVTVLVPHLTLWVVSHFENHFAPLHQGKRCECKILMILM